MTEESARRVTEQFFHIEVSDGKRCVVTIDWSAKHARCGDYPWKLSAANAAQDRLVELIMQADKT